MSKSLGNVVAPQKVIEQNGADILRLWVVSSDYYDDLRIGPEIIKRQSDHYRRIRNTLRYLLGAGEGFDAKKEGLATEEMPELERWVLHRLTELDKLVREKTGRYDFHAIFTHIHDFCNGDLSAFYFDIRKDTLYCDSPASIERRACRTVMDETLKCLISWIAPICALPQMKPGWPIAGMRQIPSICMNMPRPRSAGITQHLARNGQPFAKCVQRLQPRWRLPEMKG